MSLQLILGQAVEYSRIRIAPGISTFETTTTAKLQKLQPIKEAFARSQGQVLKYRTFRPAILVIQHQAKASKITQIS